MKLPNLLPQKHKKLRATAVTRRVAPAAMEEDPEPTMRLSSAFIVVVILHLVAVGGIYTFESIKTHRGQEIADASAEAMEDAAPAPALPMLARQEGDARILASNPVGESAAMPQPRQAARHQATEAPRTAAATPAPAAPTPQAKTGAVHDSGKVHVVVKGENPVAIARKYHVEYEDLLKLNKITDPTKLQINQKLHIPAKE